MNILIGLIAKVTGKKILGILGPLVAGAAIDLLISKIIKTKNDKNWKGGKKND